MKHTSALTVAMLSLGIASTPAAAEIFQSQALAIDAQVVASGLENPWGLDFLPGGDALVTERSGSLRILAGGSLSPPVEGVPPVWANGQGGLLDVVASPDFATSNLIFLSFSEPGNRGAGTAVVRAKLVRDGTKARLENVQTIFSMARKTTSGVHFGSRLVFHPDGTLFITTGERGEAERAQDMGDSAGAVLRINPDGSIPADNPWAAGAQPLPELWSKGHRNAQGAIFDPLTRSLLTAEHGAKGGDEINQPRAGSNYGWPVITYGVNYDGNKIGVGSAAQGYEQPLHHWDPSIAPSGLAVYQGEMFPEWNGDLLIGSLKFALLSRLERDEKGTILGEERLLEGAFGRIRDVNVAPDGSVWLLTDEADGAIIRLSRAD